MPRKRKGQPENYFKAFPTALRKLIDDREITHQVLAEQLGKSRQAISYYCDGSSSPDLETLVQIAKFFSVSTDYLLGLVENPTSDQSVQGICQYTGLSPSSAELLHADNSSTGFTTCLVDTVLRAAGIGDSEMARAIDDSALALATSLVGNAAFDETRCEVKNKSAVIRRNGKSEYSITAEAAADWFLMKATDLAKSNIDDAVRKMRDNYVVALVNPQRSEDTSVEFVFTTVDESEIE